jgi:NMD protein affecting ribosome stability and mRNA decay
MKREAEPDWRLCRHCGYIWVENKWYEDKNFNCWRRTCCKTIPVTRREMKAWTDELKKISKYERYRIQLLKEIIGHAIIVSD